MEMTVHANEEASSSLKLYYIFVLICYFFTFIILEKGDKHTPPPHQWSWGGVGDHFRFLGINITENLSRSSHFSTVVKKQHYFLRKLKKAKFPMLLLVNFYRSNRRHPDWKHYTLARGLCSRWLRACSPCCRLASDTEVFAAVPPDYRAASFLRLWDSSIHPPHPTINVFLFIFFLRV